ncbi:MAG: 6-bladed beta-propeller [Bacteroidota bacterium]
MGKPDTSYAQTQDSTLVHSPKINWIEQYPALNDDKNHHKKNSIADFLFGKKMRPELTKPLNIAAINKDRYCILDQANGSIFQILDKVGEIPHFRHKPSETLPSLVGFCLFPQDKLLFTDSYLNKVFVYNIGKKSILPLNDSLRLNQCTGIAYSELTHEIWVVETAAHSISILTDKGTWKKRIGKRGVNPGEFNFPTSIWIDKLGRAYIVDALNFRIQVFDKEGELISVFGRHGDGGGDFARPKGIATDSNGNIYIVDALFNVVQVFDIAGKFLYTFGSQGHGKGEFWMPSGLFIDDQNFIYVADSYNSRVQIFQFTN